MSGKGNGGALKDKPEPSEEAAGLEAVEPEAPVELTRDAFEALRKECFELREQLLRRRAEFENYKKRVERDRQQAAQDATASLLEALLPALDSFDHALDAAAPETTLREGVELIRRQLLAVLETKAVEVQDAVGQAFDPEVHQALSYESAPGFEDGTVVEVFRKGYFLGGRLLRPALVKVAVATPALMRMFPAWANCEAEIAYGLATSC